MEYETIKDKGKVFPVHAMKANGGSRGLAPFILSLDTRYGQPHFPAALSPRKEPWERFE